MVLRIGAWRFVIYVDDHEPPHVHVKKRGGGEAKATIPGPCEYVSVLRVRELPPHEALRAVRLVEQHRDLLFHEWEKIHG